MAAALFRNPRLSASGRHFTVSAASVNSASTDAVNSASTTAAASVNSASTDTVNSASTNAAAVSPTTTKGSRPLLRIRSKIRSERDPEVIAHLFKSSSHLPHFHSDRILYELSVRKLHRSGRHDLIDRLLADLAEDPSAPKSEGFLVRILTLYASAGMVDQASRTYDGIAAKSELSFSALLSAFLKNKRFDSVVESFYKLSAELGISPGIVPHNMLLRALCEKGDLGTARSKLDEMVNKEAVKPDLVSYNTVLNAYLVKGDDVGFDEILEEISSKGFNPDVVTYNYMISRFCRKAESLKAEELLDEMVSKGIEPNRTSFSTIIAGFCKEGNPLSAMRVFKRMRALDKSDDGNHFSPDSDNYTLLIRSLVEKGEFGSALEVCKGFMAKKLVPPFELVKELVDGLKKDSKVEEAKDIMETVKATLRGDTLDAWKKIEGELSL